MVAVQAVAGSSHEFDGERLDQRVPVQHEEVCVEREPITGANHDDALSGSDVSEEEHEGVLHEDAPVVEKRTVPKERVRLDTDTVPTISRVSEDVHSAVRSTTPDASTADDPASRFARAGHVVPAVSRFVKRDTGYRCRVAARLVDDPRDGTAVDAAVGVCLTQLELRPSQHAHRTCGPSSARDRHRVRGAARPHQRRAAVGLRTAA